MEEFKKFHSSTFDTIARRRRLDEDQNTILELSGRVQELQNEINCMTDSRKFQDAESVRSGNSHVTSQPVSFPPHPILGGMPSRSIGMPSGRERPPSTFGTRMVYRVTFFQIQLRPLQHLIHQKRFAHQQRRRMRIKHQFKIRDASPDQQPKIDSSLVRDSVKNYGADQQRLQISDKQKQIPYISNACLLEDKVQDRGMCLFTVAYGSYALDQRSGDG